MLDAGGTTAAAEALHPDPSPEMRVLEVPQSGTFMLHLIGLINVIIRRHPHT